MVIEIAAIFSPQTVTLQKGSNFYFRKDFWTRKTIEKTAEKKIEHSTHSIRNHRDSKEG